MSGVLHGAAVKLDECGVMLEVASSGWAGLSPTTTRFAESRYCCAYSALFSFFFTRLERSNGCRMMMLLFDFLFLFFFVGLEVESFTSC